MTQTTSLLWKQWHETRIYLWVGLGLFLGLPVIGAIEYSIQWHRRFEIEAYGFPLGLGGVLAVFLAVGITSIDFRSRLEDFWRSRPVSIRRWIGIKYLVGLAALELAVHSGRRP
jgi:hypothetical protein